MVHLVLNQIDNPLSFAGVPLKSVLLFLGAFLCGAFFDSFLAILGGFFLCFLVAKSLKKFSKFSLVRIFYKNIPTKIVFKKHAPTLLESHIEKWIK